MTVDTVPTVTNADQLAQVESVPLRERGLAWTTYELVRAAARPGGDRERVDPRPHP